MTGVDTVELEVRDLVRGRGIDPVTDRAAVRRLVDEVVAEYDERALTSTLPSLGDPRQAARAVYDAVAGFGPLQRHLDDPSVQEICPSGVVRTATTSGGRRRSPSRTGQATGCGMCFGTTGHRPEAASASTTSGSNPLSGGDGADRRG